MANQRPAWLTRNLLVLTLVSLTQDAASELLYPLLPLLLSGVLAAPPVVLGVIEGVADATAGITKYFAGRWSDRFGRKKFVAAGYGLAAVGKVLVAAAGAWQLVLAGRVVDRFGKGVRSAPRDAMIAASVPRQALGRAFGFHRAGDTLGAVIGPLLGLWALSAMDGDLHAALWWAVVPATLSVLLVFLVADRPLPTAEAEVHLRTETAGTAALPRRFWRITIPLAAVALFNFSDALVLLRVMQLGFDTTHVVAAYVVFNTVYTLGSYPAGALTDRWPRPYVYAIGLSAFAVGYLGLGMSSGGWKVYLFAGVYGLFPAFTDGVGKAWIASVVPAAARGRSQGVFQSLNSGAVLAAGLWAGLLWETGPGRGALPLVVSGAVGAAAAAGLVGYRMLPKHRKNTAF